MLKKALNAAQKLNCGLLEATEVIAPNSISPNDSICYSNLFHCDRDDIYLYIDTAMKQLAQAMKQETNK